MSQKQNKTNQKECEKMLLYYYNVLLYNISKYWPIFVNFQFITVNLTTGHSLASFLLSLMLNIEGVFQYSSNISKLFTGLFENNLATQ